MKASKWLCLLGGALISVTPLSAQMKIVQNGKPAARIIADPAIPTDMRAAELLQDFVQRISDARLEITDTDQPRKGDILIGEGNQQGLTEDGFRLKTDNGRLYISSGGDKGTIYGVVTLLERYLGVSYYGANAYTLTESKDVHLPAIDLAENPAFRYRQSQCYAMAEDPVYKDWFRFEEPQETFAGGYWVHTFERILPSDVYGKSHPEFYSLIKGERRPGKASQWCLTNPELFEVVCTKIDSIFKANPGMKMISVSQNDGNFTNCSCPACKELDQREGGPSGSLIHFLNRLAERFPDKEFSTLAYLFTMHPPREVKPLPNVNIMLCDIDCMREVPLTDNASGRDFVRALEGWSAISNNLFIWDYGINFDNMVAPFPNFPILQKNIQLFKKHHATMHFSQIGGSKGSCFPEMRAYMVSKLMWNPYQNSDSLMRSFMNGYYGAAAPYIYQYEKLLEGGLLASQKGLWIYDSPVTHKGRHAQLQLPQTLQRAVRPGRRGRTRRLHAARTGTSVASSASVRRVGDHSGRRGERCCSNRSQTRPVRTTLRPLQRTDTQRTKQSPVGILPTLSRTVYAQHKSQLGQRSEDHLDQCPGSQIPATRRDGADRRPVWRHDLR